jgi:hypothetical protein
MNNDFDIKCTSKWTGHRAKSAMVFAPSYLFQKYKKKAEFIA